MLRSSKTLPVYSSLPACEIIAGKETIDRFLDPFGELLLVCPPVSLFLGVTLDVLLFDVLIYFLELVPDVIVSDHCCERDLRFIKGPTRLLTMNVRTFIPICSHDIDTAAQKQESSRRNVQARDKA